MRLRLLIGAVGLAMGAFGALRFLQLDLPDIVDAGLWLVGGVLVHDALLAPLTIGATALGVRMFTRRARAAVVTGLVVVLTVTVTAIPVLGGWGARADNATLLDRNYAIGWAVFAALVLVGTVIGLVPLWRRHAKAEEVGDGSGAGRR